MNNYTKYFIIVTPYMLTVSTLYLFGYWSVFRINILEFIGIGDIIKLAIYQLAYSAAFLVTGAITSEIFLRPLFPVGGGTDEPTSKFIMRHWRWALFIIFIFIVYLYLFTVSPGKWIIISFILGPLCGLALSRTGLLSELISNEGIRSTILCLIAIIPFFSFTWGIIDGYTRKNGNPELTVKFAKYSEIEFRYIGFAGGYFFIYDKKDNQILMVANKDVGELKFQIHEKDEDLTTTIKTDTKELKEESKSKPSKGSRSISKSSATAQGLAAEKKKLDDDKNQKKDL